MKNKSYMLRNATILTVVAVISSIQAQAVVYQENWNAPTYTTGGLSGQNGWTTVSGFANPTIAVGTGINTSQVASNSASDTGTAGYATKSVSLGLSSFTSATLSFDVYRNSPASFTGFGLGDSSSSGQGVSMFVNSNQFSFRPSLIGGTAIIMTDFAGAAITMNNNSWYRLTLELNLSTSTVTSAFATNLTASGSPFQMYFGAGQASTAFATAASTWNAAYVRTGLSTGNVASVDNIQLTAIPEPSTFAAGLLLAALAAMVSIRRKRLAA